MKSIERADQDYSDVMIIMWRYAFADSDLLEHTLNQRLTIAIYCLEFKYSTVSFKPIVFDMLQFVLSEELLSVVPPSKTVVIKISAATRIHTCASQLQQ